jgi:hypothetical protein
MLRAFGAIYAGVTLRMWLPVLSTVLGDFALAYSIVPFLAWCPTSWSSSWSCAGPPCARSSHLGSSQGGVTSAA